MEIKIKPCPFCGHMPEVWREYVQERVKDDNGNFILKESPEFIDWVYCINKDCFMHFDYGDQPPTAVPEEWNKRFTEDNALESDGTNDYPDNAYELMMLKVLEERVIELLKKIAFLEERITKLEAG
jgi:hypothetical protein